MTHIYTDADDSLILEMRAKKFTRQQIGIKLGVSENAIKQRIKRISAPLVKPRKNTLESKLCACGCGKRFYRIPNTRQSLWDKKKYLNATCQNRVTNQKYRKVKPKQHTDKVMRIHPIFDRFLYST